MRRIHAVQGRCCGLLGVAGLALLAGCAETMKPRPPAHTPAHAPAAETAAPPAVDVASAPVPAITPGTVVGSEPPKGYSHLILKSQPRVGADSIDKVSASLSGMASMLFTAVVADCRKEKGGGAAYTLASVAAGVGTKVKGQDMVLSSESAGKLSADLGLVGSTVLSGGEKQLQRMRSVARSNTLAILDAPTIMLVDGKHVTVLFRYAILADPTTGQLNTVVWPLKKAGAGWEVSGPAEWLPENKVDDCQLHVDTGEFVFGMPTASAFAVRGAPKGRASLELTSDLKTLAATSPWTASAARQLENSLRALLAKAAKGR